jgi:hypothetical protein
VAVVAVAVDQVFSFPFRLAFAPQTGNRSTALGLRASPRRPRAGGAGTGRYFYRENDRAIELLSLDDRVAISVDRRRRPSSSKSERDYPTSK